MILRVSKPVFNEIAILLASSGDHERLKAERSIARGYRATMDEGRIIRIDCDGIQLEESHGRRRRTKAK